MGPYRQAPIVVTRDVSGFIYSIERERIMTEVSSLKQAVLLHRPLGDEHPYLNGPTERTPRYPLAGEVVTVGIQAAPEIEAISLRWTLNGAPQATIQAEPVAGSAGLWRAALPAQGASAEVTYWIEAKGASS